MTNPKKTKVEKKLSLKNLKCKEGDGCLHYPIVIKEEDFKAIKRLVKPGSVMAQRDFSAELEKYILGDILKKKSAEICKRIEEMFAKAYRESWRRGVANINVEMLQQVVKEVLGGE